VAPVSPGVERNRRMKNDLIWGWISTILVIVGILLIIFCVCVDNWAAIPACVIALLLNAGNAAMHFHEYKYRKQKHKDMYSIMSMRCWSDYDKDKPEDDNRITD
jgi:hypothetical protein